MFFSDNWRVTKRSLTTILAATVSAAQCLPAVAADSGFTLPSQLNLSSPARTVVLPGTSTSPVTIRAGGQFQTIMPGASVTAAQALAVQQVLSSGRQSIMLSGAGTAVGGSFILASQQQISSLTVPHGVTGIRDFAGNSVMNLSGNLYNGGRFFALSTSAATQTAIINAVNITNSSGALLTTVLPPSGFAGFANASTNLSLMLGVSRTLINAGTISSAGDLSLVGNSKNFVINNASGVLSAVNSINLSSAPGTADSFVTLNGGNLLSQQFNVNAGEGTVNVLANQMTGQLNVLSAGVVHLGASTSVLNLGNITVSGDPTFFNSLGSINISGPISVAEKLVIAARGDVTG
jgi:hypothetical protein